MGQRPYAKVGFGFHLPQYDEEHVDLGDLLCAANGVEPDEKYEDGSVYYSYAVSSQLEADCPITLLSHGHDEYPYWFVAIKSTVTQTDWDDTKPISLTEPDQETIDAAKAAVAALGWEWNDDARFEIMASYG